MHVIALLATYNEERALPGCVEHLRRHGVDTYLIDNGSTDGTLAIARRYLHDGIVGIESSPRDNTYRWQPILRRKEALASTLEADWFMHVDADEIHLPPRPGQTLAQALAVADEAGYNAVNFTEYTFLPTQESPDHDHPDFRSTMRWYVPFVPYFPHLMRAWKRCPGVELAWSGGHQLRFPGLRLCPVSFPMRHYLILSVAHAIRKYVNKRYDPEETARGWHEWRARIRPEMIRLPRQAELRPYLGDDRLDPSDPRTKEFLGELYDQIRWAESLALASAELGDVLPDDARVILLDEDRLGAALVGRRPASPFLERDGRYWGPPPDDDVAIAEFERLRRSGARSLVVAWPAFWWLGHYSRFHDYLRLQFSCLVENERLIVFDLGGDRSLG